MSSIHSIWPDFGEYIIVNDKIVQIVTKATHLIHRYSFLIIETKLMKCGQKSI